MGNIIKEKNNMEVYFKKHIEEINTLNLMLKNKLCSKIDEISRLKEDVKFLQTQKKYKKLTATIDAKGSQLCQTWDVKFGS